MRIFGRDQLARTEVPVAENNESNSAAVEEDVEAGNAPVSSSGTREKYTDNAQNGVLKMEATTLIWTRNDLILAYIL